MALKGEWQVSLPSFSPLPSRLTALWQSRGPTSRLFLLTSLLCSAIPSTPFILSQYESHEVGEKYLQANGPFSDENTFRNLSATFFSTKIQTFWSCFILKYQNTKTTTTSNVFLWLCHSTTYNIRFLFCIILSFWLFFTLVFPLLMTLLLCKNSRMCCS